MELLFIIFNYTIFFKKLFIIFNKRLYFYSFYVSINYNIIHKKYSNFLIGASCYSKKTVHHSANGTTTDLVSNTNCWRGQRLSQSTRLLVSFSAWPPINSTGKYNSCQNFKKMISTKHCYNVTCLIRSYGQHK